MSTTMIDQLAALYGIEPSYHDISGQQHQISRTTQYALLAAMGVDTTNAESLTAALAAEETRPWRRLLAPVLVTRAPASPLRLSIHLPQSRCRSRFTWEFREEEGNRQQGEILAESLPCTASKEIDGVLIERRELELSVAVAEGYHHLSIWELDHSEPLSGELPVIVAPRFCYVPAGLHGEGRVWGPALQLYGLRSRRNWGVGDFTDLSRLIDYFAEHGAGVIGINPINARIAHQPAHKNPHRPSSRLFLDPLYLDIESMPDFLESLKAQETVREPQFQVGLANLRETELVDYAGVGAAKKAILELIYRHFLEHHLDLGSPRARDFRNFQEQGGETLRLYGIFEALQEHFHADDSSPWGWPVWPETFRNPSSPEVLRFAEEHREKIEFFHYLQWQTSLQLGGVGRRSFELGLHVGLYAELPVSVDGAGAESWMFQDLYARQVRAGTPPNDFNVNGRDWGLPPLIPTQLRERAYAPFIATLRNNMRHAGALCIDHMLGLMRLFWVPAGKSAAEGAYVRYPFEDLVGILALESQRNRCLVVGNDSGISSDEGWEALRPRGILLSRIFYFEKDETGAFKSSQDYPDQAMVTTTTPGLPTLAGYWRGRDLELRSELALFPTPTLRNNEIIARAGDRARLLLLLERNGLIPEGTGLTPDGDPELLPKLALAVHTFLARTKSKIFIFQMEDVFGFVEQANLPGTVDEYPNWQRKLPLELEEWPKEERITLHARAIERERGRGLTPVKRGLPWPSRKAGAHIPVATYRLQFNRDFTFGKATELVFYLRGLGVSHCYASPFLKARPGSLHGYDIIDHNVLNPEIGEMADFERFTTALRAESMGLILDMVPNHMGIGSDNPWWMDILENGEASDYADFFDIDWHPIQEALRGKVLLPLLEDHYGNVLEKGLLVLQFDAEHGEFSLHYHEHRFPLDPASYALILGHTIERLEARFQAEEAICLDFRSLVTAFGNLPGHRTIAPDILQTRQRDKEAHKRFLVRLCRENVEILRFITEQIVLFNGTPGDGQSYQLLHELLERQAFRLAYWRVASDEINYRRFFDINDLAALCMENRRVFEKTHRFVLELLSAEKISGLRIDHPDGLYDPDQYYQWLSEAARGRTLHEPEADGGKLEVSNRLYVVVEKILAGHERLRSHWLVHGTTGYEFANLVGGLFVDSRSERAMTSIYTRFIGQRIAFDNLLYDCKKLIIRGALSSEFNVLANELERISQADWHTRDFTLNTIREALMEIVAYFPVYRTYVTADGVGEEDRRYVEWATSQAVKRSRAEDTSIFGFIQDVLLLAEKGEPQEAYRRRVLNFALKFQQYTGPVMAKGLEDTSFYIYNRLLALNEVGGDPRRFGTSVAAFHRANQERAEEWPGSMLGTSTHDSKRSEDVRARLAVLSEIPEIWQQRVRRWKMLNRRRKCSLGNEKAPSMNDEYALYQNLLGAWPLETLAATELENFAERIRQYAIKAVREAKDHSSWININQGYEKAMTDFIASLLEGGESNRFLGDFLPFQRQVAHFGLLNSLSQLLLKLTAPGVPDIYQGDELWRFDLVDPDNRRPVDYASRQGLLKEMEERFPRAGGPWLEETARLLATLEDGKAKFFVTRQTLNFRDQRQTLFRQGGYVPLAVSGECAEHVVAFARVYGEEACLVVVPRMMAQLLGFPSETLPVGKLWGGTAIALPCNLSGKQIRNVFTTEHLSIGAGPAEPELLLRDLLAHFPVALFAVMSADAEHPTGANPNIPTRRDIIGGARSRAKFARKPTT